MQKRVIHAFTKKALQSDTPLWAKNIFRVTFIITTAFSLFLAGTGLFTEEVKYELILALKAIDALLYGVSKMFGVEIREEQ
jgi:hypothetical protein